MAFDGSLKFDTAVDSKGFQGGIDKIGSLAADGCKVVASALAAAYAAAGAAVAGLTKTAIENYAEYEQLVGGVETLFKDSADAVMDYANAAYNAAGLSANAYMDTVTSFSASLLQALGGDTQEAADKANMAIVDMSDNANKMGSDMASIQNAYQGFAKQNYTMLDNLKLGYGGTKEEMARLLTEAQKISGVQYDISSFADIVDAIHVVQTEMGITGTTAKEASTTISGSINSAKAAWTNWVTGLADNTQDFGELTENLVNSVVTVGENIIPRIEETLPNVVNGLGTLISKSVDMLPDLLPNLAKMGTDAIGAITSAMSNTDGLADAIAQVGLIIVESALNLLPELLNAGISLITKLISSISEHSKDIATSAKDCIMDFVNSINDNIGDVATCAVDIVLALINAITEMAPELIPTAVNIVLTLLNALYGRIGDIILAAYQLVFALIQGITESLPKLAQMIPMIISSFIEGIIENLPQIIQTGIEVMLAFTNGCLTMEVSIVQMVLQLISALKDTFTKFDWSEIGKNILSGIGNGIKNGVGTLIDTAKDALGGVVDGVKDLFGIHSPSTLMADEVGKQLPPGIGIGFENAMPQLESDVAAAMDDLTTSIQSDMAVTYRPQYSTEYPQSSVYNTDSSYTSNDTYHIYTQAKSASDARVLSEELARLRSREKAAKGGY